MNEKQLSERLIRVAHYVSSGSTFADIGSDHAYLPCYICLKDETVRAIAGEVNEGPYQSARKQVIKAGLTDQIAVRKGNGLAVIEQGEVDTITIAGMGGGLISTILEEGKEKLAGVHTLILQPNVSAELIRKWLRANNWTLANEEIIEEDDKIYEVLVAHPGDDATLYEDEVEKKLLLGPYLLTERNDAFKKKWRAELQNWERIVAQFERASQNEEIERKREELTKQIEMVREVLS